MKFPKNTRIIVTFSHTYENYNRYRTRYLKGRNMVKVYWSKLQREVKDALKKVAYRWNGSHFEEVVTPIAH